MAKTTPQRRKQQTRETNWIVIGGLIALGVIIFGGLVWLALRPTESQTVQTLAEFGVVFLMFSLGLEFSLGKLASLRTFVFGLGPAQVGGTIGLLLLVVVALPAGWIAAVIPGGLDWRAAIVLGGAAIVVASGLYLLWRERRSDLAP